MDYIYRGNMVTEKQFGGILYSLVSLAVISGKSAEVYPVLNLGEDEFEHVLSFLEKFDNINTKYVNRCEHKTRIVSLYYKDASSVLNVSSKKTYDREESSTEPTLPVKFEQVEKLLPKLDGILINMVSGVDMELNDLLNLRRSFNGYIHMDLHNLVMQTFPDGTRKQVPLKHWEKWTSVSDTLQMNESEFAILTGDNVTEYNTAEKILSNGRTKTVAVTRGRQGVSLYEMKEKTSGNEKYFELDKTDLPMIESPDFTDSTGCGDVFASAFFCKNAVDNLTNFNSALHFANRMASANVSLNGIEDLENLTK
jgi:bifunctional ADP-heptose synthase (sugar kinase/adenylyltransferase)